MSSTRTKPILPWRQRLARRTIPHSIPATSKFDLYLVRAGYIAQVGALVAAIAGFYYTVIPLYQKAAVDEQLAKRESELKAVEERLTSAKREAYEVARGQFMERLAIASADACSEMRKAISQPTLDEPEEVRRKRMLSIEVVPSTCLRELAAKTAGGLRLTGPDQKALATLLADVGGQMDSRRKDALASMEELKKNGARHPERLDPPGPAVARMEALQDESAKLLGAPLPAHVLQRRAVAALHRTEERIAQKYREAVFHEVLDRLRSFKWPTA